MSKIGIKQKFSAENDAMIYATYNDDEHQTEIHSEQESKEIVKQT